ncbi:DinB family protein [Mucilaginibacter sabulilitoris]|uniref:DinB family protein n=1 Tax=Mucilaginibacter sabulilitoris TaxID=1173583 RepID=A0ABZ0TDU0_9SPHI|nr:DinB family protein [Mucilaginibacter sabulilitoris]WPU91376.1 DinB family protein [Mucilaginibacter sabulilitoris]
METQNETSIDIFIKVATSNWELQNTRLNGLLDKLSDEQLLTQTAPDRNTGLYLLGHLTAVSDGMFTFLELGERLYPEFDHIFVKNPDIAGIEKPSIGEVKEAWNRVNSSLKQKMEAMQPADWFAKHSAISAEDFEKEPHRNKINILINRTNHQSYHMGQLMYLKPKA